MTIYYPITSRFYDSESFREGRKHLGLDLAMPKGTELRTIQDGVVERVLDNVNGLGKAVYIKWQDGKVAIYGHMNEITVKTGERLKIGDTVGYSGNTGNVVGANGGYHLHFSMKDSAGNFIDPEPYAPLLQEMNHNLLTMADKMGLMNNPDGANMFNQAMRSFAEMLQGMDFNIIVYQLVDYTEFIKSF